MIEARSDDVPSPCTLVCKIDMQSGACRGCGRSIEEIVAWPTLTPAEKRAILRRLQAAKIPQPAVRRGA